MPGILGGPPPQQSPMGQAMAPPAMSPMSLGPGAGPGPMGGMPPQGGAGNDTMAQATAIAQAIKSNPALIEVVGKILQSQTRPPAPAETSGLQQRNSLLMATGNAGPVVGPTTPGGYMRGAPPPMTLPPGVGRR